MKVLFQRCAENPDLPIPQRMTEGSAGFDLRAYVGVLASREYEGRGTGLKGERMATAYVAKYLETLGLEAMGDGGGWFQPYQ